MNKMKREEKILAISDRLMHFDNHLINAEATRRAAIIYDAIDLPENNIGKFLDDNGTYMYGQLERIDKENIEPYQSTTCDFFKHFQPMTPEEITEDIKKQMEEKE